MGTGLLGIQGWGTEGRPIKREWPDADL